MRYFCELTNMKTGEVLLFNSCAEASDYLKKSKNYVAKCLDRNIPVYGEDKQRYTAAVYKKLKVKAIEAPQTTAQKGKAPKKKPIKQKKPKDKPPENNRHMQLCYSCKKACGGCSWSKKFEPVEGWTAVPTIIRNGFRNHQDTQSYKITACPEYERG